MELPKGLLDFLRYLTIGIVVAIFFGMIFVAPFISGVEIGKWVETNNLANIWGITMMILILLLIFSAVGWLAEKGVEMLRS